MKKFLATILTLVMALSVTTMAWAEGVKYPEGVTESTFTDGALIYVDKVTGEIENAQHYFSAWKDAVEAAASGATLYCKESATIEASKTSNDSVFLTGDLTIQANGATFTGMIEGTIAVYAGYKGSADLAKNITLKVYDAVNFQVWGSAPPAGGTLNVYMENCKNTGDSATGMGGRLFYVTESSNGGSVNLELVGCSVAKSASPVYCSANGSVTVKDSQFSECAVPVNLNFKGNGTRVDKIDNCTFDKCGCDSDTDASIASFAAPIRFVNSGSEGAMTVEINNVTFTNTVGDGEIKRDILLGSASSTNAANVTVTNTDANVQLIQKVNDAPVTDNKTVTSDKKLTVVNNGEASVVDQPTQEQPPRYYYYTSTTSDTKKEDTKGSPKTFDAGVGVYALTAVLSVTGMACVGKKKL